MREDSMPENSLTDENDGGSFLSFLLGFGVGLGISFLFTPRSGQQNRQLIAEKAKEGVDRATLAAGEFRDEVQIRLSDAQEAAQDFKDRVGGTVAEFKDRVQEAVRAGHEAYRETLEERKAELEGPSSRAATSGS
jgi:gas vesicle protein